MDTAGFIGAASLAGTIAVGIYAARSSRKAAERAAIESRKSAERAAEIESQKVDQNAYNNAISYYEKTLTLVSGQLEKVTAQVERLSSQLAAEKDVTNQLRDQVWSLEHELRKLTNTVEERSSNPLAPKSI